MEKMKNRCNPFYYNYIFEDDDKFRIPIFNWRWKYPILNFLTTYVQSSNNYDFFSKYGEMNTI